MKTQMTLKDVLKWMIDNSHDLDAMDEINRVSYAFMQTGRRESD